MDSILRSVPAPWRQAYLDHQLSPQYGFFRDFADKVTALKVLELQERRGQATDFDPHALIPLVKDGEIHQEPIQPMASYVLLLFNRQGSYATFFDYYKSDPKTLSALNRKVEQLRDVDPDIYPGVRKQVDEVAEKKLGKPLSVLAEPR